MSFWPFPEMWRPHLRVTPLTPLGHLRVYLTLPPRSSECFAGQIAFGSACMFIVNPSVMTEAPSMYRLEDILHSANWWGYPFLALALFHITVAILDGRKLRRLAMWGHSGWGLFVFWSVITSPPIIAPSDILFGAYALNSIMGSWQLRLGRAASSYVQHAPAE